jgi:ATP-binding cassette subfamily F protein 3
VPLRPVEPPRAPRRGRAGDADVSILRLQGVRREYGPVVILDAVDAAIALGDRIGLVGPNGSGKTTLLRIAAGLDEPDRGTVGRKRGLRLGMLAQEAHLDERFMSAPTLRDAVRHGAGELEAMERELRALEAAGRVEEPAYAELRNHFDVLGGYTLDLRVEEALSGLGFSRSDMIRAPARLSGGEQTRAALARLVVADPDLMLLDEPTNHLDLGALEWLEAHLRGRAGSLVVASHDRAFLDGVATRVWELRDRRITVFRGNYSAYRRQRDERDARSTQDADTQARQIARERELVQRYRSHRKYSKMHEHEARLERLEGERQEAPRRGRRLKLPTGALAGGGPVRSGEVVLRLEGLVVGYAARPGVRPPGEPRTGTAAGSDADDPDAEAADARAPGPGGASSVATVERVEVARIDRLLAGRGERIGIVGPNGAGKTTLLRTIAGELPPLDGHLSFGHNVQLGYLSQLRAAAIPGATVLDAILKAMPVTPGEARSHLARFLFRGDDVAKEVRSLSGGERSRLELALLGILPSNLLLLDEPTNHLDIPAREAIETYIREHDATVLVVSHDRRLLEETCDRLWVVDDGRAVAFDGGYAAWRAAVADGWTVQAALASPARTPAEAGRGRLAASTGAAATGGASPAADSRRGRGARAEPTTAPAGSSVVAPAPRSPRPKLSKDAYRRQLEIVEADLTRLGLRKSHLELALDNPSVQANFVELRRVTSELADVETALATVEEAWLELEERKP